MTSHHRLASHSCALLWSVNLRHSAVPNPGGPGAVCARCTEPWPCHSMLLGYDLGSSEAFDDTATEIMETVAESHPVAGHVQAVHAGKASDSGGRLLQDDGTVAIDIRYDPDVDSSPWALAEPEVPERCNCSPGPALEDWPRGLQYAGAGSELAPETEPHQVTRWGAGTVCSRCETSWPCPSVIVGRDVDPAHERAIICWGPGLEASRWFFGKAHAQMAFKGICRDVGARCDGAIIFLVDETLLQQLVCDEEQDDGSAPGSADDLEGAPELSPSERDLLHAMAAAGGCAHEEELARELNLDPNEVRQCLRRLASLGLIRPPRG